MNGYAEIRQHGDSLNDVVPMVGDKGQIDQPTGEALKVKITAVEVTVDTDATRTYRLHFETIEEE
jgi:hypothetical protein